ncbi:MAG: DNA polymerase I, partial [Candidatus Latescibacterota bacterium]
MALFLVDGHALAYRAYYAFIRRPLVNSKGEETSAVYGFVQTLLNLLGKFDPDHIAVVFDTPEKTFRSDLFADYKANRPEMPESLITQMDRIFEVLAAMSIPVLSLAGYEADDIIATLSKQMEKDTPVRIVSGDKDLFQLITERTHIIRPGKGGVLDDEIDADRLVDMSGLRPDQFADYQSLMGDSTDNIPGVPGVGEKTALKLIKQFGSLDGVFENVTEVGSKSIERKLTEGKDKAYLSRQLVRLDAAVPIEVTMDDLRRREFDPGRFKT